MIDKSQIHRLPVEFLPDIIGYVASLDLGRRSVGGVQADVGIRGSSFEQVLILLDGVRMNDPQTGHFNLDLPITKADIERIEILRGGTSSIYGPGAFSGAINIITKRPQREKGLEILYGEHSLFDGLFWAEFPVKSFRNRLSFQAQDSSAYRPETEFRLRTLSYKTELDLKDKKFDLFFGYNKKDFGADSFYSASYPRQEEHTDTRFLNVDSKFKITDVNIDANLYFRRHWDKFILDRTRPVWFVNWHTNYVYGFGLKADKEFGIGTVAVGTELIREKITSTNLGGHQRDIIGNFFAVRPNTGGNLFLDLGARFDKLPRSDLEISPSINLAYRLKPSFKLRGSVTRSFRTPSFTDLFYVSPANVGNPNLTTENNVSLEAGFDYFKNSDIYQLTLFKRFGRNLIDWTRTDSVWNAKNIGSVNTEGLEFSISKNLENFPIENFSFDYTLLDSKKTSDYISKYALAYLEHQAIFGISNKLPFGLMQESRLAYKQRIYQDGYFLLDMRISKKKAFKDFDAEYFIDATNLGNTSYEEISGSPAPGRWFKTGIRVEF